jgi:hypothetical protein
MSTVLESWSFGQTEAVSVFSKLHRSLGSRFALVYLQGYQRSKAFIFGPTIQDPTTAIDSFIRDPWAIEKSKVMMTFKKEGKFME